MRLPTRIQSLFRSAPGNQVATIGIALAGGILVWGIATQVFPYHSLNHDEGVYLQQAGMLLNGQLNLYPTVEDSFRPWFFIEDGGRLYPKYAPVPAVMFALGQLLGEYRLALAGIAIGNLVLVMMIVRIVFDHRTSLLAGVFVLASPLFLLDSSVFLPYAPTTLLNLLFAYTYFKAQTDNNMYWAAISGGAIGLAFFARPYTAILFATPFIGHAFWTLYRDWSTTGYTHLTIAIGGLGGVALTLMYNSLMTGSLWIFPYEEFAPRDGLGFGRRQILGHEVFYTPELAIRANQEVVTVLFTEWVTGGILGASLVVVGLVTIIRHGVRSDQAVICGIFASVIVGNIYFWGTFNMLGELEVAEDGLIGVLGPYYHFDVLLPTAAFAATGAVHLGDWVQSTINKHLPPRQAQAVIIVLLLISAGSIGAVTVIDINDRIEANMDATTTYQTAYEPFSNGLPDNSLILLPTPYGDWLNHPFQYLRNDPSYDNRAIYAINDRPFVVADAFPDRHLYRYEYRGPWAPSAGSPDAAQLQPLTDLTAESVQLTSTVGVPSDATSVTVRLETNEGTAYYVGSNWSDRIQLRTVIMSDQVVVSGPVKQVGTSSVGVTGRDTVGITIFVDYGPSGGFTYRFDLPVTADGVEVRVFSPRIEWCQAAHTCGGAAAYIPDEVPDGVFVKSTLAATEHNQ